VYPIDTRYKKRCKFTMVLYSIKEHFGTWWGKKMIVVRCT
jgi:hypothetical protein